jgi:hypothetical protein
VIVLAILGMFTFSFIDNATKTYLMGSRQRMLYQEASYIMERVAREVGDAQAVSIDSGTGGLQITKSSNPSNSIVTDSSTSVLFYRNASSQNDTKLGVCHEHGDREKCADFSPTLSSVRVACRIAR